MKKIGLVFFISQMIAFMAVSQSDCKLRKNKDGIKVYTCHVDTSKFKSIVAEFTVNASMEELAEMILDVPNYSNWQFNTVEAKIVKTFSSTEVICHTIIEAPWPVTDRDMVVRLHIFLDEKKLFIKADSETGIVPINSELVRVPYSHTKWFAAVDSNNQLHVRYEMLIDPGGAVPAWLVNWVCANAPLQSFQKLKLMLEKK